MTTDGGTIEKIITRSFAKPVVALLLGLPWLGAHFRIDALAAFFLVVVNLGGAAASLFALGYGRHEHSPQRVLPFYPAYLAATLNAIYTGRESDIAQP